MIQGLNIEEIWLINRIVSGKGKYIGGHVKCYSGLGRTEMDGRVPETRDRHQPDRKINQDTTVTFDMKVQRAGIDQIVQ